MKNSNIQSASMRAETLRVLGVGGFNIECARATAGIGYPSTVVTSSTAQGGGGSFKDRKPIGG